jgi:type I restriction enzyme R subunit
LARTIADLRAQMAAIPLDAYSVQRVYPEVERTWQDSYWHYLTRQKLDFLRTSVAPLLRFAPVGDVQAVTFTTKVERLKLQIEAGQDTSATVSSIARDASRLPQFVYEDAGRAPSASTTRRRKDRDGWVFPLSKREVLDCRVPTSLASSLCVNPRLIRSRATW